MNVFINDYFVIYLRQIVNGKIPDELLRTIPEGVTMLSLYGRSNLKTLPKNLPKGLKELNLYACRILNTLPKLPLGLRKLDASRCNQLSRESIACLEALEEVNQNNSNFQLIWPANVPERLCDNNQI